MDFFKSSQASWAGGFGEEQEIVHRVSATCTKIVGKIRLLVFLSCHRWVEAPKSRELRPEFEQ